MNSLIEKVTGLDKMNDQVIATDFLISAKTGIRNYSVALTEAYAPEVRALLRKQLGDAITTYEIITNYMLKNGFYHAYDPGEQFKLDMKITDTTLGLTEGLL